MAGVPAIGDRPCSIYNILDVSTHEDTVFQTEENVAIKEYVVRKTLDLLFFSLHFLFLKKKTKQNRKKPEVKRLKSSYRY